MTPERLDTLRRKGALDRHEAAEVMAEVERLMLLALVNAPWGSLATDHSDPNFGRACLLCRSPIRAGLRYMHECPRVSP
jgi:hypothetical protein